MKDELDSLSDLDLSRVFAVECAGWSVESHKNEYDEPFVLWRNPEGRMDFQPKFAEDANLALSFLSKMEWWHISGGSFGGRFIVLVNFKIVRADDVKLARAICKAILRAKRGCPGASRG